MHLDNFKRRTLARLATKGEGHNVYPIEVSDLFQVERCGLCGSGRISPLTEAYLESGLRFFSTSVCEECLYTFRPVSPSLQWFHRCWKAISTRKLEVFNPDIEAIRKQRYQKYYRILKEYITGGLLLDIGASYGTGAQVFRERGFDVEAVEPEDDRANYIESFFGIPVRSSSIEGLVLEPRRYNVVIFAQCLEHLDDPTHVILRVKDLLDQETGILYLEVPLIWNAVTWSDALYLTHKSNFSEENLSSLLARGGFQVLERVWIRNTESDPWELGLVLRLAQGAERDGNDQPPDNRGHTVDDVRRLYRKGLPLSRVPALDKVLRYKVSYIEQFYCTLRFDTRRMVEPAAEGDFISFEDY